MIAAIWGSLDAQPHQQQPDSANSPKRKMTMGYLNPTQSSQEAYDITASLRATLKNEAIQTVKERAREHNAKIEDTLSAWRQQLLHDADTKTFETSKRRVEAAGQRREEALALKSAKGASMSLTLSLDR
jgi:transposase-like protein